MDVARLNILCIVLVMPYVVCEEYVPFWMPCKLSPGGIEHAGNISVTRDGLQCQRWDSQSPHEHGQQNNVARFPESSLSAAENYCRNPDNEPEGPWCYTTDPDVRWQYCDVDFCEPEVYKVSKTCKLTMFGGGYHGTENTTVNGRTCQRWDRQYPHKHNNYHADLFPMTGKIADVNNYCRNPDGETEGPWCYTTDPDVRWEYCDVKCCVPNCEAPKDHPAIIADLMGDSYMNVAGEYPNNGNFSYQYNMTDYGNSSYQYNMTDYGNFSYQYNMTDYGNFSYQYNMTDGYNYEYNITEDNEVHVGDDNEGEVTKCFTSELDSALYGHNTLVISDVSLGTCQSLCLSNTEFTCLSLDYLPSEQACFLSSESAKTDPAMFGYHAGSNHYERKPDCENDDYMGSNEEDYKCAAGGVKAQEWSSCYLMVHSVDMSWDEAKESCAQHGYRLASIDTSEEMEFLDALSRSYSDYRSELYWIGGKRTENGHWVWDMGPGNPDDPRFSSDFWEAGEPNNYFGEEDKALFVVHHDRSGLNDYVGANNLKYICEYNYYEKN